MAIHIPKRILCIVFLLLALLPLYSHEGSMAGAGKLRVSQTEYFDIIYSQKNLDSARILYENADAIFEELASAYGIEPYFRIPVVITATVEQFNAYYSDSFFNRIVIYDTSQIEDLAVFSQTLLSTFKHELTHALTYNLKSKGFKIASKLLGDPISGHYITVTSGMAEGATVSYESAEGEGRLNDSYALQMVRQAKIEGKFPSYSDVKGAADSYPRGSFYYFNGAFAEYLQKTYGMEKYAQFWYRCVNVKNITTAGAFKKVYGIKLDKAWKQFEESFVVPQVSAADPVAAGIAKDFFLDEKGTLSIKNRAGSRYSSLCISQAGVAFADDSCNTVYFYSNGKIKKLFTKDYLDTISISKDGRFLAVSYYTESSPTTKHCASIYDIKNNKWIKVPGTNYTAPSIVSDGSDYYFVVQEYESQQYSICVKKLEINGKKVKVSEENYSQRFFNSEEVPKDFTDLGNGCFAYILKSALDYSVCVSDVSLAEVKQFPSPLERMKLRELSASYDSSAGRLTFSWALKDTLPRLGYLDLSDGTYSLSEENISGGVYTPVEYQGHLYYTAKFYKETRLFELLSPAGKLTQYKEAVATQGLESESVVPELVSVVPELVSVVPELSRRELPYKPFSPFSYAFEGLLLPIGGITSTSSTPTLGFTYLTTLPWYSSITAISGGYDISSKAGLFDFSYQSGTDTGLFQYIVNSSFAVDGEGFKYFSANGTANSVFDFGTVSAVSLTLQADANYGRLLQSNSSILFSTLQLASVTYSTVSTSGPGTYEKAGFAVASGVAHSYEDQIEPSPSCLLDLYDLEFDLAVYIPKLIPVTCVDNFTYNLPVKIKTALFSLSSSSMRLAKINAETVLFGYDIQKAVPFLSAFYLNDIILSLSYTGGFDYASSEELDTNWHFLYAGEYFNQIKSGTLEYKDFAVIKLSLGFTPNIGIFANPQLRNNLYISCAFGKKQNLPESIVNFGFEAKF